MSERIHLDHAATTPVRPASLEAFVRASSLVGNPSALHASGRASRAMLEDAREQIAAAVGAEPVEVVLTSGGSEADTLAVHTGVRRWPGSAVLVSAVEHPAVHRALETYPNVHAIGADQDARVTEEALRTALSSVTASQRVSLVSVQSINNELGTIQPVEQLARLTHQSGAWFHTDAVQALGHIPVDFSCHDIDLMTLSGHKVGAPVGVGALLVRKGIALAPHGLGGRQEGGARSGTVPVALACALAAAISEATAQQAAEHERLTMLRDGFVTRFRNEIPDVRVNGGDAVSPAIVHVTFAGLRADDLLLLLDQAGVDASTGSACRAGVHQPSEVVLACGGSLDDALGSIRFSFGRSTTADELEKVADLLPDAVSRARIARGLG